MATCCRCREQGKTAAWTGYDGRVDLVTERRVGGGVEQAASHQLLAERLSARRPSGISGGLHKGGEGRGVDELTLQAELSEHLILQSRPSPRDLHLFGCVGRRRGRWLNQRRLLRGWLQPIFLCLLTQRSSGFGVEPLDVGSVDELAIGQE